MISEELTDNERTKYNQNLQLKNNGYILYDIEKGEDIIILKFVKGDKRRTIKFNNPSKEIIKYIQGHQKGRDKDFQQLYIRLDEAKFGRIERIKPYTIDNAIIVIGETLIKNFYVIKLGEKKINDENKITFQFYIKIQKEKIKKFKKLDFRDHIILAGDNQTYFKGKIDAVMHDHARNELMFYCSQMDLDFPSGDDYGFAGDQDAIYDMKKFLLDYYEANEIFQIDGFHQEKRDFLVEMGFTGIDMTEYMNLGKCIISKPGEDVAVYEFFPENIPRMVMNLKAGSYHEAIQKTRFYFQNAINLMNFRNKIPQILDNYISKDKKADIKLLDKIFIRDIKYMGDLAMKYPIRNDYGFYKKHLMEDHFKIIQKLASKYCNPEFELTTKEKLEIWIFHFLNLAEITQDPIISFLHIWTAIEFLVNRFWNKSKKKYNKAEKRILMNYINQFPEYFEKNKVNLDLQNTSFSEKMIGDIIKRSNNLIGEKLNEKSLSMKLFELLTELSLDLNNEEKEIYKIARDKRNKIIHGVVTTEPTKKEYNVVSKIVYLVLKEELF